MECYIYWCHTWARAKHFGCHPVCVCVCTCVCECVCVCVCVCVYVCVLAESQTLAAAALTKETQGSQDLLCCLEKVVSS